MGQTRQRLSEHALVDSDIVGVGSGVTTVLDCGSTGAGTFQGFRTGEFTVRTPDDRARAMGLRSQERRALPLDLHDVCEKDAVAQRVRGVFGQLLESLALAPTIQVDKRVRLTRVAQGLVTTSTEWGFSKALLSNHFRDALAFLRTDLNQVLPLL